ncbi:SDR family oxidoreductase [Streptomyces johnsoniae]|uniref:SDR family oxidoreductase n=1 Tax=Streptomyces johnsoniae TaxID=3075532 RepID=A0ABU2S7D9_9ACTN|nr:SDR family oxidoreductase [Streptomyces sp. DSM 41886]MDT0444586.1 SDR family oxidoreductase [Streptomyces sp. DSM 41886]
MGAAPDTDVLVVGAGPVGLMLAGELRLGGADVVVVERRERPTTESRASTLHARTMEILDARGLLAPLGPVPDEPRGHFGGIPLDLTLPGSHPGQWKVPQTRTEELLGTWAAGLGARPHRGHRLRGLHPHRDHVQAEIATARGPVRLRARYVVGCDGERSTVRSLSGIAFPGRDAARELLRADVAGLDVPDRRFQRLARGLAIAARRGDGVTRVMVHEFGAPARTRTTPPAFAELADAWRRVTGEDISEGTPLWVNSFGDASRQAAAYRNGRIFLAGDAAHRQMPIGGQALNLGLQDAVNLGWKLAAHLRGHAPDGLLDTYHAERHPVGAHVLANIRAQATLLLDGPQVAPVRAVMAELTAHEAARAHLAGMISGLGVRYDLGPGHPLLGARLPPTPLLAADGRPTTSAELLRTGRGLLLSRDGDEERAAALHRAAAGPTDRITPARGPATGPPPAAPAVLVRADGHVAWAGDGTHGLAEALNRWFGPAAPRTAPRRNSANPTRHTDRTNGRNPMGKLTGKTALVTGSSRGMGRATAVRLAREGALVAVHYATGRDAAEETVTTIEGEGGSAFTIQAELGMPGDVHELFLGLAAGLKERTGGTDLHILINNAGRMGGLSVEDTTPEAFDRLMAVNAKAPFFLIQRALANMPDGGRIINISSGLTHFANPDEIAYAMTKGAVEQLALHFAKLLGPRGITVNTVAPGITRNSNPAFDIPAAVEQMAGLSAFNGVGEPEDIADVVAFLAGEDACWITGSFVDASGGTLLG